MAGNKKRARKSAGTKRTLLLQSPNTSKGSGENIRMSNIMVGISDTGKQAMKSMIATNFNQLVARTMDSQGWNNLQFRLYLGAGLAQQYFTKEAYDAVIDAINVLFDIQDRWVRMGANIYAGTPEEISILEAALDATDDMQDMSTRRELHVITTKVNAFVIKTGGNKITRNGILVAQ